MDGGYQVNRRKACQLCSRKKIKCDMLKPTCSNCQLYKAQCHTSIVRKRYGPASTRPGNESTSSAANSLMAMNDNDEPSRMESVETRLARIEQRLGLSLAMASGATSYQDQAASLPFGTAAPSHPDKYLVDLDKVLVDDSNQVLGQPYSSFAHPGDLLVSDTLSDCDFNFCGTNVVASSSYPRLPPLAEIQPTIDRYFTYMNSLVPLFSQNAFSNMLQHYYASSCQDPRVVWAAVNVVLALATRLPPSPSSQIDLGSGDREVATYVNNAQSVLPELLTRNADLLGLQIVLGLVRISNALKDSRPAVVLVGTAVRLAQRLRLHTQEGQDHLSSDQVVQHNRVFWIAYLFDRDICLRHHTPSVQPDADIDVKFPPKHPPDGAGKVYTSDGQTSINFFRLRLRLAYIQGRVYNLLFATRAAKITPQERWGRVVLLHKQLEHWRLSLPSEFQAEAVVDHVERTALVWICMMHFSYLGCLVMIHGIWSHDAEWRKRLTIGPADPNGELKTVEESLLPLPLPRGWKKCVRMSRNCMALIYRMSLSDCSVWANGCAYFSALLILEANLIEYPLHERVDWDLQLTSFAVSMLDKMSEASNLMAMKRMNVIAAALDRRARLVIRKARQAIAAGESPLSFAQAEALIPGKRPADPASLETLQWTWGNDRVEGWPSMDFSVMEYADIFLRTDNPITSTGPFGEWADGEINSLFSNTPFDQFGEAMMLSETL